MKKLAKCFAFIFMSVLIFSCVHENTPDPGNEVPKSAHEVTMAEAEAELLSILNDLDEHLTRSGEAPRNRKIGRKFSIGSHDTMTRAEEGEAEAYTHVFNFEGDEGFAIMAGDERVSPLLVLTESGSLDEDTVVDNPGMIMFLANMEELYFRQIEAYDQMIADNKITGEYNFYEPWRTSTYGMKYGNCEVRWDQTGDPYSLYTPNKYHAGCAATAVAQLMSIYKKPASYGGYSFNWNEMVKHMNISTSTSYTPAHDHIGRLMQQLGISKNLDMTYSSTSSSADADRIPRTFKNFGYSKGGSLKDYSTSGIVNELKYGYHSLIYGYSTRELIKVKFLGITVGSYYKYSGGHIWLAHGLLERTRTVTRFAVGGGVVDTWTETEYYPLCNMGWSGFQDGYYLSGAFDARIGAGPVYTRSEPEETVEGTEGESYNYQFNINMITGIRE